MLLDINLRGVRAFSVADELIERSIPLVFATGYSDPTIPERYRHVGVLQKPFGPEDIARALFPIVGDSPPGPLPCKTRKFPPPRSGQWCRRSNETGYES